MTKGSDEITRIITAAAEKARAEVVNEPEAELTQRIEWPVTCTVGPGLEGAIACETKIGYVNGTRGALVYRGYDMFDLCAHSTFEEVSYLLLHGNLPDGGQLHDFDSKLKEFRLLPHSLRLLMGFPVESMTPMAALRLGSNLMRQYQTERDKARDLSHGSRLIYSDEDSIPMEKKPRGDKRAVYEFGDTNVNRPAPKRARDDQQEARGLESCYRLISGVATITAAIERVRKGHMPIEADQSLSHAANLLYMMTGKVPTPVEERILDIALILHADHGMNASTFASMVVASTLSDIYFSIGAGIAALNGPLHGGANEEVIRMLREIGGPDKVERWYRNARKKRKKIMGFGHRVYKAYDPRARVLAPLAAHLVNQPGHAEFAEMFETAQRLEALVIEDLGSKKGIFPNVDFYSGMVYSCLGIPPDMFTPLFAVARVSGWTARVLEYMKKNRIFRPRAMYVGGFDRPYIPMIER